MRGQWWMLYAGAAALGWLIGMSLPIGRGCL